MEANAGNKSNCSEGVQQLPLAMFAVERKSNKRLLFDVSTRKIRGVSSYIFPDATCAFENRGWLLMIRHKPLNFEQQTVFLVHPSSGKHLDLPVFPCRDLEQQGYPGFFVFYVGSHGTPLVVARFEIQSIVPTVHVACPGDTYWSVYKHGAEPEHEHPHVLKTLRRLFERTWVADLALLGTEVVCVDVSGQVLVFDITEMTWGRRRTMAPPPCPEWSQAENHRHFSLVASQTHGEVVLVSRSRGPGTMETGFEFFRLDMEAMEWSRMDDRELDDTSWFLCTGGQSFRVKDASRRRVYTFSPPKSMNSYEQTINGAAMSSTACFARTSTSFGHDERLKSITNVYAYDLDDDTVEMVIPASLVTEVHQWVQPSMFATTAK